MANNSADILYKLFVGDEERKTTNGECDKSIEDGENFEMSHNKVTPRKSPSFRKSRFSEGLSKQGMICYGFLKAYMESSCDRDPSGKQYRMAVSLTRQDLYGLYCTVYGEDQLKSSQFYEILKTKVPELRFNKTQRQTCCSECLEYRGLIEEETDPEERAKLMETRNIHLMQQQLEREAYYVRRAQAEMMPTRYFSIILDGMDQHKTDLPHYHGWNNPNNAGARKIKTHIVGGIAHGRGKYFFVDVNEYPHDTNLTLSCLVRILRMEAKENKLPATLYVQLDNTTRENKNKYFLGMMAYLVKKHYIRECYISFLIVGHTHEDVDQAFSKVSHVLRKTTVLTQDALLETIERSQDSREQQTAAFQTDAVWNISEWLTPYINQVHNVTFPKLYRIFEDHIGHVTVQYKRYSCDDAWRPMPNERPLEIFRLNENSEQIIPPGTPNIVLPSLDQEDLRETKRSMKTKDFTLATFDAASIEQWNSFFENPFGGRSQPFSDTWQCRTLLLMLITLLIINDMF